MSQSLGNQGDACVTKSSQCDIGKCLVALIFVLTSNKYLKLDVIGKDGKYFIFIPKAFFYRDIVA